MNNQQRAAMQMALEALEFDGFTPDDVCHRGLQVRAITALREAWDFNVQGLIKQIKELT